MASTIRKLAQQTGLSPATVSMALRGVGRVSPVTRTRVQAEAKKAGYQPLPLLAKALSLARQPHALRFREVLGFITEYPVKGGPLFQRLIYEESVKRAQELGFTVEPFYLSGKPSEQRQLGRVLHARGIRGLVLMPRLVHKVPRVFIQWEKFAAVEIGKTLWSPRDLHRVERPLYYELLEALHLLKRVGYRRIGLAVEPTENKNRRGVYTAALLFWQQQQRNSPAIPSCADFGAWNEETFREWFGKYSPDVLIMHDTDTVIAWLRRMGLKAPRDVSAFCSNVGMTPCSGLRADWAGLGGNAVEMLSLLLNRNELGQSSRPRCWEVADFWQAGETLRLPIADYITEGGNLRREPVKRSSYPRSETGERR